MRPVLRIALALTAAALSLSQVSNAQAERRVALVIGNDAYSDVPKLEKAASDARTIAQTLSALGFDVASVLDANRARMSRAFADFETRVSPGDTALFFYAGHGVSLDGANYLLPTDIPLVGEGQRNQLKTDGFLADDISERLRERGAAVTVMILDACRNNPFKTSGGRSIGQTRGLSRIETRRGLFVMFSAGAGQEALDRLGPDDPHPNSVFTRLFVNLVKQPELSLTDVAKELQIEVPKLASRIGHNQFPAYYDEIAGKVFLARAAGDAPPQRRPVAAPPAPAPTAPVATPAAPPPVPPVAALPPAPAQPTYRVLPNVSQGIHNMRAGPGTNHALVVSIPAGSTGLTIGRCRPPEDRSSKHNWCEAKWRNFSGWVSSCCVVDIKTGAFPR